MRLILRFFLAVFLVLCLLLAGAVFVLVSGIQREALVQPAPSATHDDVERLKRLLKRHDPRRLQDNETHTLTFSERDLNLGLRSVLPLIEQQYSQVFLHAGRGQLDYTLELPQNPLGVYLNFSLAVQESDGSLTPEYLQAGELRVPGNLLAPLAAITDAGLKSLIPEYRGARNALQNVRLDSGRASVTYRWDQALAEQIEQRGREVLMPDLDRERAVVYYQLLSSVSRRVGHRASLTQLLQPLFETAELRSAEGDAVAENRALLLVLGTVLNRSSIHRLVGGDFNDLLPGHYYVYWTLHGRGDLAQHFAVSAAIAAAGGGVLANAIGVFKELDDSRGGSGFSFPDLLADRAGVELSAAATGDEDGARVIQGVMAANSLTEKDFVPRVDNLPEGLMEMEFKQRFRDLDDARYAVVKREINTRIAELSIHR